MRTQFFHCDICKKEIKGKIAVFAFNDVLIDKNLEQVAVNKQADFCEECANDIIKAIDDLQRSKNNNEPQTL